MKEGDRRPVATFGRSGSLKPGDRRESCQEIPDDLPERAGSLAMDDPHKGRSRSIRLFEVWLQLVLDLMGPVPTQIDLDRHGGTKRGFDDPPLICDGRLSPTKAAKSIERLTDLDRAHLHVSSSAVNRDDLSLLAEGNHLNPVAGLDFARLRQANRRDILALELAHRLLGRLDRTAPGLDFFPLSGRQCAIALETTGEVPDLG